MFSQKWGNFNHNRLIRYTEQFCFCQATYKKRAISLWPCIIAFLFLLPSSPTPLQIFKIISHFSLYFFYRFILGFLMHIRYNYCTVQYRELGLAMWRGSGWGSNSRPSVLAAFNCTYLHRSWTSPVGLPKQVGYYAVTEIILPGRRHPSFSNHPTVLASQDAWITGECQCSVI